MLLHWLTVSRSYRNHPRYQRPGYVRAMADLIETEIDQFPTPEEVRGDALTSG